MDKQRIMEASKEARKFMARVAEVLEAYGHGSSSIICGCKETGALRRQSMELTRALAKMRKA